MFSSFGSPRSLWDRIQAWSSRPPHTLLVDSDLCGRRPRRMLSRLGGTDVKRRLDNRSRFHYGRKPPLDLDMDVVHTFFLVLDMGAVHKLLPNCRLKDANPVPSRPHARSRRAARRRLPQPHDRIHFADSAPGQSPWRRKSPWPPCDSTRLLRQWSASFSAVSAQRMKRFTKH